MAKIFFVISILLVNNHYFNIKSSISALRQTKNIYYKNQLIGKNIEITIYEGEGEIYSIYFFNNSRNYIRIQDSKFITRKERFDFIIKKYKDLQETEKYSKEILIAEKDKEIKDLFENVTYELEIYINGEKYKYIWGYEISNFYVFDNKGQKIFGKNAIDYMARNSNEIEAFLNLWICNKSENHYFDIDISKEECKEYEYRDEYFPCTEIEDAVLKKCDYWNLSEKRKLIKNTEAVLK